MSEYRHVAQLESVLAEAITRPTFAAFLYEPKAYGPCLVPEVQHVTVILGADTENLYQADIAQLMAMLPNVSGLTLEVVQDILNSRNESLRKGIGHNSRYTQENCWSQVYVGSIGAGAYVPGLFRRNGQPNEIQIRALLHHKSVVMAGKFRPVNSTKWTIERNNILRLLPSNRFRAYSLCNIAGVRVNGDTLEFDNVVSRKA